MKYVYICTNTTLFASASSIKASGMPVVDLLESYALQHRSPDHSAASMPDARTARLAELKAQLQALSEGRRKKKRRQSARGPNRGPEG